MHICSLHLLANKFWQHITYSACAWTLRQRVTCVDVAVVPALNRQFIKITYPIESWLARFFLRLSFNRVFILAQHFPLLQFISIKSTIEISNVYSNKGFYLRDFHLFKLRMKCMSYLNLSNIRQQLQNSISENMIVETQNRNYRANNSKSFKLFSTMNCAIWIASHRTTMPSIVRYIVVGFENPFWIPFS